MNARPYLLALTALLVLTGCTEPEPVAVEAQLDQDDPSILQRPFTAEQIRDEWVVGFSIDMARRSPERELVERWTVVAADAEGVEIRYVPLDAEGKPAAEGIVERSTWIELRNHASFPADSSTVEKVTRETALGSLEGLHYTVRDEKAGTVTEFFFASSLPGAPVQMRTTRHGQIVLEISQVARSRP
jgi:hypothetical protein